MGGETRGPWTDSLDGGDVAWGESYVLRMYINLYDAFGERLWLDKLVAHVDRIFAKLQDKPPDPPYKKYDPRYIDGYYGWGQNRYDQYKPGYTEWFCDDGLMISPILCFVELVWNDPALHAKYKQKADSYVAFLERYIIAKWHRRWDPDPGWTEKDKSRFRQDRSYHLYEWSGWKNQPLNMYLSFTDGLVTLHRLSKSPFYKPHKAEFPAFYAEQSKQMLRFFHDQLRHDKEKDLYVWKYGPNSAWSNRIEDVGHGFIDIQAALQGVRSEFGFTKTDLKRMANTFVKNVWNGSLEDPRFRYYLDGRADHLDVGRGYWGFGFLYLAEYDYRIWRAMAAYFEQHIDIMKEDPYIAVTAAMLACAAQVHDRWAPGPPHQVEVVTTGKDFRLSWQRPQTDAGGTPLTGVQGYVVYRAPTPDGPFNRLHKGLIQADHYEDAGAASTSTFYYRVTAVDYRRPPNEGAACDTVAWRPDKR
jgi:hypothetical protein